MRQFIYFGYIINGIKRDGKWYFPLNEVERFLEFPGLGLPGHFNEIKKKHPALEECTSIQEVDLVSTLSFFENVQMIDLTGLTLLVMYLKNERTEKLKIAIAYAIEESEGQDGES